MLLADVTPIVSTQTSLIVALVSGLATVAVAVIGLLGAHSNRKTDSPSTATTIEIKLLDDLRCSNSQLRSDVTKLNAEINRLRRICWSNRIDPADGKEIDSNDGTKSKG